MVKNMGRWWFILFCGTVLLGTIYSHPVTSEDKNVRHTRQPDECCPCPVSSSRTSGDSDEDDQDQEPNVPRASLDTTPGGLDHCPCMLRGADSEASTSMQVSNPVRSLFPFVRSGDSKEDTKPLLHPEVDLASSVLETLKEATDEEYRDAVARDAARNAAKAPETSLSIMRDTSPAKDNRKVVTIVINPEDRSATDDTVPDESHVQEARCILPPIGSTKLGQMKLLAPKPPNLLKEIFGLPELEPVSLLNRNLFDMDNGVGATNIQERVFSLDKGLEKLNLRSNPSLFNLFPNSLLKPNTKTLTFPKNIFESLQNSHNSMKVNDQAEKNRELNLNKLSKDTDISPSNLNEQTIIPEEVAKRRTRFKLKSLDSGITDHTTAGSTKPFDLKKLLKLRDVELIPTNDVINKINKILDQAKNTKKFNVPDLKFLPNLMSTTENKDRGIKKYSLPKLSDLFGNSAKLNNNHELTDKEVSNGDNTKSNSNILIIPKEKFVNTKNIDTVSSPSELQLNCNDQINPGDTNIKMPIIPKERKIKTEIIDTIPSSTTVQPNCDMKMDSSLNIVETEIIDSIPALEPQSIEPNENEISGDSEIIEISPKQPNREKNIDANVNDYKGSTSNNLNFGVCNAVTAKPVKKTEPEKTMHIETTVSKSEFGQNVVNDQETRDIIKENIINDAMMNANNLEESEDFFSVAKSVPDQYIIDSNSIKNISRKTNPQNGEPESRISSSVKNKIFDALGKLKQPNISGLEFGPEKPSISENDNNNDSDETLMPDKTVFSNNENKNIDFTTQINRGSVNEKMPERHHGQMTSVSKGDLRNDNFEENKTNDSTKSTDIKNNLEESDDSFSSPTKTVPPRNFIHSNSMEVMSREIDPQKEEPEQHISTSIKYKILDALNKLRQPNISFLQLKPKEPSFLKHDSMEDIDESLMPDKTVLSSKTRNENLDSTTQLNEASKKKEIPENHRGEMTSVSTEDSGDDIIEENIIKDNTDNKNNLEESDDSFSSATKNVPEQISFYSKSVEDMSKELDPKIREPEQHMPSSIKNKILDALEKLRQPNISFLKLKPKGPSVSENDNNEDTNETLMPDETEFGTKNENLNSTTQLNESLLIKEIQEEDRGKMISIRTEDTRDDIIGENKINGITKASDSENNLEESEDSFNSVKQNDFFNINSKEAISREIDTQNEESEKNKSSSIKNKIFDALEKLKQPNLSFIKLGPKEDLITKSDNKVHSEEALMPVHTVSNTEQNKHQFNEASMDKEVPEKRHDNKTSVSMEDLQKMSDSILFASDRKNLKIDLKNSEKNKGRNSVLPIEKPNTEVEDIPEERDNISCPDLDPSFTEPDIQVDNLVSSVERNDFFFDDGTDTVPTNEVESMVSSEEVIEDFIDTVIVPESTPENNMSLDKNVDFLIEDDKDLLSPDRSISSMTENKSDMISDTLQEVCQSTSLSKNKQSNIKPPTAFETESKDISADGSEKIITTAPLLNYKSVRDDILGSLQNIIIEPPSLKSMPDITKILNLKSPLPTLDEIRSEISSVLRLNDPKGQESSVSDRSHSSVEMFTDAQTDNLRLSPKSLKDISLDIFQLQPISLAQKYPITSPISGLNLNNYKAKLAIPKSLEIKPLTFKSAVSNKGTVLGASLSLEPNKVGFMHKSNALTRSNLNRKMSEILKDNLELTPSRAKNVIVESYKPIPSISDNLRLNTDDTMRNMKYPKGTRLKELKTNQNLLGQSLTNPIDLLGFSTRGTDIIGMKLSSDLNDITDNIRSQTESAMRNLQKTLKLSLGDSKLKGLSTLGNSLAKPEDILDVVSRTQDDVNDKLQSLHYDFTDRLASIRESIIDSTKFPSFKENKVKIQATPLSRANNRESGKPNSVGLKAIQSKTIPSRKASKKANNLSNNTKKLTTLTKSRTVLEVPGAASSPLSKTINLPKFKSSSARQPTINKRKEELKLEPLRSDNPISRFTYRPTGLSNKKETKTQQRNMFGNSKIKLSLPTTTTRPTSLLPVFKQRTSLKSEIAKPKVKSSKILEIGNQRPKLRIQTIKDTSGSASDTHSVNYPTSLKTEPRVSAKPLNLFKNEEPNKKSPTLNQNTKLGVTNKLFDTTSSVLQLPRNIQLPKLNLPLLSLPQPLVFESPLLSKARDALAKLSSNNLGIMIDNKITNTDDSENEGMARSPSENVNVEINNEHMEGQPMKEKVTYKCSMKCTKDQK